MSQQTRHVRIGVVYRGHVVAERVLCRRTHVSIGLRTDATVQLESSEYPDFPAWMEVLHLAGGRYHLVLPTDPTAKVTLRGASVENLTVDIDGRRCLPVESVAGGSLQMGELCVMFQFVAGYAQPMVVRERTVLRLGLVYEGRLIADRVYADERKVSVGASKADALVLDTDYRGPSLGFERHKDGTATLVADQKVALRMAAPGERPLDADELVARGQARLTARQVNCHLGLGTRGRVRMGPYTVLFQVLRQRVEVPVLPKRSWNDRLTGVFFRDPVWAASLALWTGIAMAVSAQAWAMHMTYGRYMKNIVPPEDQYIEDVHLRYVEVPVVEPATPEPPALAPPKVVEEAPKPVVEETVQAKTKTTRQNKHTEADPDSASRAKPRIDLSRTLAGTLAGASSTRLFAEDDGSGDGEVIARKAFGGGGDTEGSGPDGGLKIVNKGGTGSTYERPVVKNTRLARAGRSHKLGAGPKEAQVKVVLHTGPIKGPGQGKAGVGRAVSRKNSAVRRCYDIALRADASLTAKVIVSFTVGTAGTITSVKVFGVSGDLAECVKRKFMGIRNLPLLQTPQTFTQTYMFTQK